MAIAGTELLRYLKAKEIEGAEVIIVSGEDHYRDACRQIGFDLFLSKPVSMRELKTLVTRLLSPRLESISQPAAVTAPSTSLPRVI
ncbi:MAG: hypothetical protein IPK19_41975 [Chloroflexi bacterium]|nr:hypothetical protein [Chloroflexota bacterium]